MMPTTATAPSADSSNRASQPWRESRKSATAKFSKIDPARRPGPLEQAHLELLFPVDPQRLPAGRETRRRWRSAELLDDVRGLDQLLEALDGAERLAVAQVAP